MNQDPARKQTLKEKIHARHQEAREKFRQKHSQAHNFFQEKGLDLGKIRQHSTRLLTAGTLAGALLLSPPARVPSLQSPPLPADWVETLTKAGLAVPADPQTFLVSKLTTLLPDKVCPLTHEQEKNLGILIEKLTSIRARATLEGEHLNTCFGLIGAEQHLPRFPGDTVSQHDEFQNSGITPGRGAWGYFAWNKNQMTSQDILREKYYVAVQTLYLSDWEKRLPYLRDWYKYRKVLVMNPKTGQAVVAVVADAGPAAWTGKHFGGSPEVMYHLGLHQGPRKGPVLLLFVDDPNNQVPLGPVDFDKINLPKIPVAQEVN